MQLTFVGGARAPAGTCRLVTTAGGSVLLDAGLADGGAEARDHNESAPGLPADRLAAVVLTGVAADRSGLLPRLVRQGFRGHVHVARGAADLLAASLFECATAMEERSAWLEHKGARRGLRPRPPLYTALDVRQTLDLIRVHAPDEPFPLLPTGLEARLLSPEAPPASWTCRLDVTLDGGPLRIVALRPTAPPPPGALDGVDLLLLEAPQTARVPHLDAATAVTAAVGQAGALLIPLDPSVALPAVLASLASCGVSLPPVYLDSPGASDLLAALDRASLPRPADLRPLNDRHDSSVLNALPGPFVVLAGSPAGDLGRMAHHLKHHLWRPSTVVLVPGLPPRGSTVRRLLDGARRVVCLGDPVPVKARTGSASLPALGALPPVLGDWLAAAGRATVVCSGGDEDALLRLTDASPPGLRTLVPLAGETLALPGGLADAVTRREAPPDDGASAEGELAAELTAFERSMDAAGNGLADLMTALDSWTRHRGGSLDAARGCARILERVLARMTALGLAGTEATEEIIARLGAGCADDEARAALVRVKSRLTDASESADDVVEAL